MKGQTAKQNVVDKITAAFGNDYITFADNKIYVWADDGGEKVQIAISMTCPKTPITTNQQFMDMVNDWDLGEPAPKPPKSEPPQITKAEENNLAALLAKYGL